MVCALAYASAQAGEESSVDTPVGRSGSSGTASPAPVRIDFPERLHIVNDDRAAPPPAQVDVEKPIRMFFPDSDAITLGIAFVPDPRVPRHRRAFDIAIGAIRSGMQEADYVLDRFAFPWSRASAPGKNSKEEAGEENDSAAAQVVDDGRFGLMLFRQDCWRSPSAECPRSTHRVAAMYLVPETVTYGVPRRTFEHSLACIRQQVSNPQLIPAPGENSLESACQTERASLAETKKALLKFAAKDLRDPNSAPAITFLNSAKLPGCGHMVLLGPSFSGSIDSVARVLAATLPDAKNSIAPDVCMLSVSTTAETNQFVVDYGAPQVLRPTDEKPSRPTFAAKYYSLAVRDDLKLEALVTLASDLGVGLTGDDANGKDKERSLAVLCEESSFGAGLCNSEDSKSKIVNKLKIIKMVFPANIADIRYHHREAERQTESAVPIDVSALSGRLHLDEGAENGSEYPDSQQSPLTAASSELKLDDMLATLGKRQPKIIAVAATDVRDRLFLFDLLRATVPSALLIDMEADVLLAHPDFLHASRGIVMLASHQLRDDRSKGATRDVPYRSYATDYEALAIRAVSQLIRNRNPYAEGPDVASPEPTTWPPSPCIFVTARGGPRRAYFWGDHGLPSNASCGASDTGWDYRNFGGIVALILVLAMVAWLARRCDSWITNAWERRAIFMEFAPLPLIAAVIVFFSLPLNAKPVQWLCNFLVVGAVLAPLLAVHRAAARTYTTVKPFNEERFFEYRKLPKVMLALPLTTKAIMLPPLFINALFVALALATWIVAGVQQAVTGAGRYWLRLAMDTGSGLALLPALGISVSAVLFGSCCIVTIVCRYSRNTAIMRRVASNLKLHAISREHGKSFLLAIYAALALVIAYSLPLTLTVFGPLASWATCGAEIALSAQAIMFICWALHSSQRVHSIAATLDWDLRQPRDENEVGKKSKPRDDKEAEEIWKGFWTACPDGPVFLPSTPFSASLQPVVETYRSLSSAAANDHERDHAKGILCGAKQQASQIAAWIVDPATAKTDHGCWAIYRLLVSEVNALRWSAFGALASCLVLVLVVYAFPAPGGDNFLLLGLAQMLLAGMITAYAVISLERSKYISRVLCNTSERVEFSWTYFAYLLAPVLLMAIAVAILEAPGVLAWGNGLMSLLKYIGLF
jgi:hypothetical protein